MAQTWMREITVKEWIAIPDNPVQRDTERHLAKAKHLMTPLPIHSIVYAAELPNGTLVKLDGHTRALAWKRNMVRHPTVVRMNVIPVKDMEEAKQLYATLDSKEALESVNDKVAGAFRMLGFTPQSALCKRGAISTALRIALQAAYGTKGYGDDRESPKAAKNAKQFSVYELVTEYANEIFALDAMDVVTQQAPNGIIAAFVMTYRKHGDKIIPFWRGVFGNNGTKMDGRMDGVQAVCELILARRGKNGAGGSASLDICARTVNAAEKWLRNEDFQAMPRPIDLTNYIAGVTPQFKLIKKAAAPA